MGGDAIVPAVDRFAVLLELQDVDTEIGQVGYQLEHHELLGAIAAGRGQLGALRAEAASLDARRSPVVAEQDRLEMEINRARDKIAKLDASLYAGTVTAHKDLEAIQHEIAHLRQRVSEHEDAELEQMELLEPLDAEAAELAARIDAVQTSLDDAAAAWAPERAALEARHASLTTRRSALSADLPADLLSTYEGLRSRLGGIGAARLDGSRCQGCHLQIPAGEMVVVKAAPADSVVHCPECNRILVR